DRVDHGFGYGAPDSAGPSDRLQSLMAGDNSDHNCKNETFDQPVEDIGNINDRFEIVEELWEAESNSFVVSGRKSAAQPADQYGKQNESGQRDADRHQPWKD